MTRVIIYADRPVVSPLTAAAHFSSASASKPAAFAHRPAPAALPTPRSGGAGPGGGQAARGTVVGRIRLVLELDAPNQLYQPQLCHRAALSVLLRRERARTESRLHAHTHPAKPFNSMDTGLFEVVRRWGDGGDRARGQERAGLEPVNEAIIVRKACSWQRNAKGDCASGCTCLIAWSSRTLHPAGRRPPALATSAPAHVVPATTSLHVAEQARRGPR
jgi:hypothetical protein